jgi:uncharacterized protein HemX
VIITVFVGLLALMIAAGMAYAIWVGVRDQLLEHRERKRKLEQEAAEEALELRKREYEQIERELRKDNE